MHAHARVQLEAGGLQALAGPRVVGVQDRRVVLLRQRVDRGEQAHEVGLSVDVLLAVCGEQHIALGLQAELGEDVRGLDLIQVRAQDLRHGRARDGGALRGAASILEVAAGVLGVGQVDIGDHVDDVAVSLGRHSSLQRLPASMWKLGMCRRLAAMADRQLLVPPKISSASGWTGTISLYEAAMMLPTVSPRSAPTASR